MSSKTPRDASIDSPVQTGDINSQRRPRPSVVTMKEAIGYGADDQIDSARAVAKYVAARHPDFDIFPALPSQFHVEFTEQTLRATDQDMIDQVAEFTVSIGDKILRRELGTVRIKRTYESLDAARRLAGRGAIDTVVEFAEKPTP